MNIFDCEIRENSRGFLSLTDLFSVVNDPRYRFRGKKRRMGMVIESGYTVDDIYNLLCNNMCIDVSYDEFIEQVDNIGILKYLKDNNFYIVLGARHGKNVWCHPLVWLAIALNTNSIIRLYILSNMYKFSRYISPRIRELSLHCYTTYIIKSLENGLYKIGITSSLPKRIKDISKNEGDVELVAYKRSDIERFLHEKYRKYRIRGEWFSLTDKMVSRIINLYGFQRK